MTPEERVREAMDEYSPIIYPRLFMRMVKAIESHTADLRTLLAQQAARADAAEALRDAEKQRSETYKAAGRAAADAMRQWQDIAEAETEARVGAVASLGDIAILRDRAETELVTLYAQVAQLCEALEEVNKGLEVVHDGFGTMPSVAAIEQAQEVCVLASQTIDAALSTPASDWLEEKIREAKAEVLEDQGCTCIKPLDDGRNIHADHCAIAIAAALRQGGK